MQINLDNRILQTMSNAFDAVWLAFLWLICSLPILTMGTATTAVLSVLLGVDQATGSVTLRFFHAFRSNFKQSFFIHLLMLALAAILAADVYICWSGMMPLQLQTVLRATTVLLIVLWLVVFSTIYGVCAKLMVSFGQAFYDVAYIALKKPLYVLALAALTLLNAVSIAVLLALSILPMGFFFWLQAKAFNKVYRAILPQSEDKELVNEE